MTSAITAVGRCKTANHHTAISQQRQWLANAIDHVAGNEP